MIRRRHGLPRPTRQQVVRRADGRFFPDVGWQDLAAAAEIHGIPHLEVLQWDQDLLRANEIVIRGPRLILFSSYAIRHETEQVAAQVIGLLRRQGWRG